MSLRPFAIIAGVGPGTGASIARKFAAAYSVVLLARNPANYEAVVSEINQSGGKAAGISTDITDEESVKKAFVKIEEDYVKGKDGNEGHLAAAVFNVGGGFIRKPFLELTTEEFESGFKGNGYVRLENLRVNVLESSRQCSIVGHIDFNYPYCRLLDLTRFSTQSRRLFILSLRHPPPRLHGQRQTQIPAHAGLYWRHGLSSWQCSHLVLRDG